jgi:hypothetical protein
VRNKIAFNGMFWNVQILLIQVKALISIILWVLNAILFSAAFRHIPFGCESCIAAGRQKFRVSGTGAKRSSTKSMCLNGKLYMMERNT